MFNKHIGLVLRCPFTCDRVQTLLGHMVVLVHPFSVAFEVYLRGRRSLAGKFDRSVFHYEGVLWLALEFRQRFGRGRWKWVRENFAVIAAIYKNREREVRTCVQFIHKHVSVTANEFGLRGNGETVGVCWERLGPWHFKCTLVIQHLLSKASLGSPHRAKMKVGELDLPLKRPVITHYPLTFSQWQIPPSTELIQGPACFTAPHPGPVTSNTTMLLTFQALKATQAIDYRVKMRSVDTGAAGQNRRVVGLHFLWFEARTSQSWQFFGGGCQLWNAFFE